MRFTEVKVNNSTSFRERMHKFTITGGSNGGAVRVFISTNATSVAPDFGSMLREAHQSVNSHLTHSVNVHEQCP